MLLKDDWIRYKAEVKYAIDECIPGGWGQRISILLLVQVHGQNSPDVDEPHNGLSKEQDTWSFQTSLDQLHGGLLPIILRPPARVARFLTQFGCFAAENAGGISLLDCKEHGET